MYLKPPSQHLENNAFNEDSDSQASGDRDDLESEERRKVNESANESNVPLMERLSATFKKRKMNSTNKGNSGSMDPRSNKPLTSEQLFIVN